MRLSSRLSDKNKGNGEVEAFIDRDKYTTISQEGFRMKLHSVDVEILMP